MRVSFNGLLSILTIATLLGGCSSAKQDASTMMQRAHAVARNKLQNNYDFVQNSTKNLVLFTSGAKQRAGVPITPVRFFVYDLIKEEVDYESELENGSVEWRNATQLTIKRIPGNITGDEGPDAFTEVYDLETRMTIKR